MTATQDRFFVDERGGCIAVRDRKNTDPDYQGLHSYARDVVHYVHGYYDREQWNVHSEDRQYAIELCLLLNAGVAALAEARP